MIEKMIDRIGFLPTVFVFAIAYALILLGLYLGIAQTEIKYAVWMALLNGFCTVFAGAIVIKMLGWFLLK